MTTDFSVNAILALGQEHQRHQQEQQPHLRQIHQQQFIYNAPHELQPFQSNTNLAHPNQMEQQQLECIEVRRDMSTDFSTSSRTTTPTSSASGSFSYGVQEIGRNEQHSAANTTYVLKGAGSHEKPHYSYNSLLVLAIQSSPTKELPLSGIYKFLVDNFPYFSKNKRHWKNAIRHNLYINDIFKKLERVRDNSKKVCYWTFSSKVDEVYIHEKSGNLRRINTGANCSWYDDWQRSNGTGKYDTSAYGAGPYQADVYGAGHYGAWPYVANPNSTGSYGTGSNLDNANALARDYPGAQQMPNPQMNMFDAAAAAHAAAANYQREMSNAYQEGSSSGGSQAPS